MTRPNRRRFISPITLRILAINALALAILGGGLLYLDQFRDKLAASRLMELRSQARIIAGAIGEAATSDDAEGNLDIRQARRIMRRLVGRNTTLRARLFDTSGELVADSRFMFLGRSVIATELPPPDAETSLIETWIEELQGWIGQLIRPTDLEPYAERAIQRASDYPEVLIAFQGDMASKVRLGADQTEILSVAVPVQRLRRVLGALFLTTDTSDIEALVREEQISILIIFLLALAITLVLSLFLARTIARPLSKLADAASSLQTAPERHVILPDYSRRGDEIGDLSRALTSMTSALYKQLEAVESFAADVAHEIKNPLSSLRSAAETLERSQDTETQRTLLPLLIEDVRRLDRLITDISTASRLDAELSRTQMAPVARDKLVTAICMLYCAGDMPGPKVDCTVSEAPLTVLGIESRLGQVLRNLIENARSFCPEEGVVDIGLSKDAGFVLLSVTDEGPGIPEESLDKIFERFYTERPDSEAFGTHSGLGLSISKQIVEAHGGTIKADNRAEGGARFVVRLPALK